jgi:hypothetical protein
VPGAVAKGASRRRRRRLPGPIFHYIDGVADDEITHRRNTELPAKGLPRHRRGQAEQDAAVERQRTRAKIVHRTEQLRPDAMILLADRREMAQRSRLTIGLETRFDDPPGRDPRFPVVAEAYRVAAGEPANLFCEKQIANALMMTGLGNPAISSDPNECRPGTVFA